MLCKAQDSGDAADRVTSRGAFHLIGEFTSRYFLLAFREINEMLPLFYSFSTTGLCLTDHFCGAWWLVAIWVCVGSLRALHLGEHKFVPVLFRFC